MVRNGYAVAYEKYSKKYKSVELEAKKNNLGIWQGDFDMPWDWRKNRVQNLRTVLFDHLTRFVDIFDRDRNVLPAIEY